MKRFLLVGAVSFVILLAPIYPIYAEEVMTSDTAISPSTKSKLDKAKETKTKALAQVDNLKMRAASREAALKDNVASKTANLKERIASKEATLKERLLNFKDKKKAAVVERINGKLTTINQRRTSAMLKHIDQMGGILIKAEDRTSSAQSAGKDMSTVVADLGLAKNALTNAKTAVETQSKKSYDLKVASESGAKAEIKATRDLLHQDLKSTHSLVTEARRVLLNTLAKLGQSLGEQTNATN